MSRVLALCADDFGLSPGISAGIARLAQARRLSAISCITNSRHWVSGAMRLEGLPDTVDLGLHLNFTEGRPLSPRMAARWPRLPGLYRLILMAHLGLLPLTAVRHEVHAQLSAFGRTVGRSPDFIDGHQHVHHLPGVRPIVLDLVEHMKPLPAVRSTAHLLGPGFEVKRWLIESTGGRALGLALAQRALEHNPVLLGAYDFISTDYRSLMQRWLERLPPEGGLLFCHPGERDPRDPPDAIAAARLREAAYLGSDAFDNDLQAAGVSLGRVWQTAAARTVP